jgi:hypothetical protein
MVRVFSRPFPTVYIPKGSCLTEREKRLFLMCSCRNTIYPLIKFYFIMFALLVYASENRSPVEASESLLARVRMKARREIRVS